MPKVKETARLIKRVMLTNLSNDDSEDFITPMLVGKHGIGKSAILRSVAKEIGGYCDTIECSEIGEKEISGLPFAMKNTDGTSEVRYVKHYSIQKIWQLQRHYFEIARTRGFLGGTVRLEVDGEGNYFVIDNDTKTLVSTELDRLSRGEDNMYAFGEELPGTTKIKLIESGEIKPYMLFFDEINRAPQEVMKEMMNIILNKTINGYKLPWWAYITAASNPNSQNSTYATQEFDPAEWSRFLKIRVQSDLSEWTDYALEKGLNTDLVSALAVTDSIFDKKDSSTEDKSEMEPDPRAWEMVAHIYDTIFVMNETKYFTPEERKEVNNDLRVLIRGKVGETAGRMILEAINNKENNIKASEIITCKSVNLDNKVVEKFSRLPRLAQKVISDSVVSYINSIIDPIYKNRNSANNEQKEKYANFMSQLKAFVNMLDTATQTMFVRRVLNIEKNQALFTKVSKAFSHEVLTNMLDAQEALKQLNNSDNE